MKRAFLLTICLLLAFAACGGNLRVHLIGDSTCATKELSKQNPERGWGQLFQPLFDGSVTIRNHAVNGRSTKSFRDEGRWQRVCDELQPGDYVFIQFGHNDQKQADSTRYASPEQYAANLRRYADETRARGAVPVLLTPVVRRRFTDGVPDDTHFNARGARAVARMIAAQLPELIPELGRRLKASDFVVAQDGSGDFLSLAEAVAAVPDFCRDTTRILVCEGTYREKIVVPATKRHVVLEGRGEVKLTWDDYAAKTGPTGRPLGTSGSSTVYFGGDGWTVRNIVFENTAGRVGQAVAVQCLGTGLHFIGCRFLGNQDTLYLYGVGNRDGESVAENARIRFDDCYVEGTTDFIFGSAAALFRRCEIRSKANSYITAASTCRGQACGLIFEGCRLTAAGGVTRCWLGRPWRDHAQTVFIGCEMGAHILPEGWHDWSKPHARKTVFYAEYASEGPGAAPRSRVGWSRQLTEKEARQVLAAFEK